MIGPVGISQDSKVYYTEIYCLHIAIFYGFSTKVILTEIIFIYLINFP